MQNQLTIFLSTNYVPSIMSLCFVTNTARMMSLRLNWNLPTTFYVWTTILIPTDTRISNTFLVKWYRANKFVGSVCLALFFSIHRRTLQFRIYIPQDCPQHIYILLVFSSQIKATLEFKTCLGTLQFLPLSTITICRSFQRAKWRMIFQCVFCPQKFGYLPHQNLYKNVQILNSQYGGHLVHLHRRQKTKLNRTAKILSKYITSNTKNKSNKTMQCSW